MENFQSFLKNDDEEEITFTPTVHLKFIFFTKLLFIQNVKIFVHREKIN